MGRTDGRVAPLAALLLFTTDPSHFPRLWSVADATLGGKGRWMAMRVLVQVLLDENATRNQDDLPSVHALYTFIPGAALAR